MSHQKIIFRLFQVFAALSMISCGTISYHSEPGKERDRSAGLTDGLRGELVIQKPHSRGIGALQYTNKEELFVTGGSDGKIKIWSQQGHLVRTINHVYGVSDLVIFENNRYLLAGSYFDQLRLYDLETGNYRQYRGMPKVSHLKLAPSGNYFAAAVGNNEIKVRSLDDRPILTVRLPKAKSSKREHLTFLGGNITDLDFSRNGYMITASTNYGELVAWTLDGKLVFHEKVTDFSISQLASYSDKYLALSLGTPRFKEPDRSKDTMQILLMTFSENGDASSQQFKAPPLKQLEFSSDGRTLVGLTEGQKENKIVIYNLNGKKIREFVASRGRNGASHFSLSPSGNQLVVVDKKFNPSTTRIFSLTGRLIKKS